MTCTLKAIVAVCEDWGIGRDGDMVVSNRADMRHFVRLTKGHAVIMGRRTLESFPGGRPLRDRRNIVITRDASFSREGVEVVHSPGEAVAAVAGDDEAWVIGGAQVYRQLLPACREAVVTKTACTRPADAFFPDLDADPAWEVAGESEPAVIAPGEGDEGVSYRFVTYRNREKGPNMSFKMIHTEIHVLDLEASIAFYEQALDLHVVREKGPEDGSWKIVYLANDATDYELELTWNEGRTEPYDNGGGDIHLAFEVEDIEAARSRHREMGCIAYENEGMGIYFIADPDGFWLEILPAC